MIQEQFALLINNAAAVADRLEAEGKIVEAQAIDALIDAAALSIDIES